MQPPKFRHQLLMVLIPQHVTIPKQTLLKIQKEFSRSRFFIIDRTNKSSSDDIADFIGNLTSNATSDLEENTTPIVEYDGSLLTEPFMTMVHLNADKLMVNGNETFETCGMWEHVVNGSNANATKFYEEWPSLGYLQMITETKMCAATLISSQYVITSLDCLSLRDPYLNPQNWSFLGGSPDNESSMGLQSHLVTDIITFPNATDAPLNPLFQEHNVALVRLQDEIAFSPFSQAACLPRGEMANCFTAGWSESNSGDDRNQKFISVPVDIVSSQACNGSTAYNGFLLDSLICASHNNQTQPTCQMARGSALYCQNPDSRWALHGLLNFANPCDLQQQPAVYNSLESLHAWITDSLF